MIESVFYHELTYMQTYNDEEFTQELKRLIIASASTTDKPIVIVCNLDAYVGNAVEVFLDRLLSFLRIDHLPLIFQPNEISYP